MLVREERWVEGAWFGEGCRGRAGKVRVYVDRVGNRVLSEDFLGSWRCCQSRLIQDTYIIHPTLHPFKSRMDG